MPLDVIDKRLKDFRVFDHGLRPKTMLPQSREYFVKTNGVSSAKRERPRRRCRG